MIRNDEYHTNKDKDVCLTLYYTRGNTYSTPGRTFCGLFYYFSKRDVKFKLNGCDLDEVLQVLDDDMLLILNKDHNVYGKMITYILTNKIKYYKLVLI